MQALVIYDVALCGLLALSLLLGLDERAATWRRLLGGALAIVGVALVARF